MRVVNSRKLTLRRCTIRDACLLRADDFHPAAPLGVTIEETAVQAGASARLEVGIGANPGCLGWSGQDNLYDLSRTSRAIRLDGPSAVPVGLNAPDAWDKLMVERRSQDRPIFFPDPASVNRGSPGRRNSPQDLDGVPVGADPGQVGEPGRHRRPRHWLRGS